MPKFFSFSMRDLVMAAADYIGIGIFIFCLMQAGEFGFVLTPQMAPFIYQVNDFDRHVFWVGLGFFVGFWMCLDIYVLRKVENEQRSD